MTPFLFAPGFYLDIGLLLRTDQDGREVLNFVARHAHVSGSLLAYPPPICVRGYPGFRSRTDPLHDWSLQIGGLNICLTTTDRPEVAVKALLPGLGTWTWTSRIGGSIFKLIAKCAGSSALSVG